MPWPWVLYFFVAGGSYMCVEIGLVAKTPLNPRGYNMLGSYCQANFRIYEAIGYFRKALEVDSTYAEARSNLGNAYIQTGMIDEGLKELMITARNNRFDEIDSGIHFATLPHDAPVAAASRRFAGRAGR